ncbi:MAG: hypothetical protein ACRDTX_06455 [Pseudonocardiaceae bacterium]
MRAGLGVHLNVGEVVTKPGLHVCPDIHVKRGPAARTHHVRHRRALPLGDQHADRSVADRPL